MTLPVSRRKYPHLTKYSSKFGLISPSDSQQIRNRRQVWLKKNKEALIVWGVVLFFTLEIFRSGGRANLSCFQWIVEHTIYGSPIQYVPEEDYSAELKE